MKIKHSGYSGTIEKCRKNELQASVLTCFLHSLMLSNGRRVLSQCNIQPWILYLLNNSDSSYKIDGKAFSYFENSIFGSTIAYAPVHRIEKQTLQLHAFFNEYYFQNDQTAACSA